MKTPFFQVPIFALLSAMSLNSQAEGNRFDIGIANAQMHSSAADITGRFVPPGVNLSIGDATTLFLAYSRAITDNIDIQISGGYPPRYKTTAKGVATLGSVPWAGQTIGSAKEAAPSVFVNYTFTGHDAQIQPYVGIGINYTRFFDVKSTSANDAANGGPTSIGMTNSHGVAAKIGIRYKVDKEWSVNAHISSADVTSQLTTNTAGITRTTHIDFKPLIFVLSAGYSF